MNQHRYSLTSDANGVIESLLTRFEREREQGPVSLADFAPAKDDESYAAVVTELSRIDLEYRFTEGDSLDASEYLRQFPDVFEDVYLRTQLAFEEYRLRRRNGEEIEGNDVALKYRVEGDRWPKLKLGDEDPSDASPKSHPLVPHAFPKWKVKYPSVGESFAGFPLIKRIGEGAFSRVFLARQGDLAGRLVVLKLTPLCTDESDRLASLQHTSIIPVYSVHREQDLYGICMPLLGMTTLADLTLRGKRWASLEGPAAELVSTIRDRYRSTIQAVVNQNDDLKSGANSSADVDSTGPQRTSESLSNSRNDTSVGYVDALVDLVLQASEGLAHAHRRGIIHRDLKPANILVADDGTPILLDFNLAVSDRAPETRVVGGTLPYMSPQQLESLESGSSADTRDDVFSMGVILYELLSGELPFDSPPAGHEFDLQSVIADRRRIPTPIRSLNPRVSPGLAGIIAKCLAPERGQRYVDANELLEDLRRHRSSRPLKYARDESVKERVSKWCVRHPRLASGSTVAAIAVTALLISGMMIWRRGQHIAFLNAQSHYQSAINELPNVILSLSSPGQETELLSEGLSDANRLMSQWAPGLEQPEMASDLVRLGPKEQQVLRIQFGRLALMMGEASRSMSLQCDPTDRVRYQRETSRWNLVGHSLTPDLQPLFAARSEDPSVWHDLIEKGLADQPTNATLWFDLAVAKHRLGDWNSALGCFDVAIRMRPANITTLLNRGLCHLDMGNNFLAFQDFDACVDMRPEYLVPRFNRAVAAFRMGNRANALADLDVIVQGNRAATRMMLFRAQVNESLGDAVAARADREAAMLIPPRDANDWVARGVARLDDDPQAALDDFLTALQIDSTNRHAINNAAFLYSERLERPQQAISLMSQLIRGRPASSTALASRGILLARQGESDAALEDAAVASRCAPGAREKLQIAGIYSLTMNQDNESEHRQRALTWLASAFRDDVSYAKTAATDPDLTNLRNDQRFRQLIGGAAVIDSQSRSSKPPLQKS